MTSLSFSLTRRLSSVVSIIRGEERRCLSHLGAGSLEEREELFFRGVLAARREEEREARASHEPERVHDAAALGQLEQRHRQHRPFLLVLPPEEEKCKTLDLKKSQVNITNLKIKF